MATEQSLFGATPESIQQARDAALNTQAAQYAQMDPFQRASFNIYRGANQLGGAVGGMLGGQDPELQRMTAVQQASKSVDMTPSGLRQYANSIKNIDPNAAFRAVQQAAQLEAKIASTAKDVAAASKERQLAIPADLLKAQREAALRQGIRSLEADTSPEALQTKKNLEDELAALTRVKEATPSELSTLYTEQGKLDPIKDKTKFDSYTAKIKKITEPSKSIGAEIGEGLGLLGKALAPALKKEGEGTGEFAAKDFNTLGSSVASGTASKRNVKILKENLDQAFIGSFADTKKNISAALVGLGLPVGTDLKNAVSATELINAMGTRYVFPLVKNFPGSLAAKELDRLEKTAPNTLQQPETIKRLISLLEADIAENEFTYKRAKSYKEDKKSLINFNQADQKIEFQQKYNQLQELVSAVRSRKSQTSAEASQIKALRTELGL